jgi:prostaglandin-E synthase
VTSPCDLNLSHIYLYLSLPTSTSLYLPLPTYLPTSTSIYLTFADVKDEKITLEEGTLAFEGTSQSKTYKVDISFFKKVDAAGSTYKVLPRSIQMHIIKAEDDQEEFWPRLLSDKALEKNQVKIDWDRYVDEDEEEEGFDTSALEGGQGMGGMPPGMGGMGGMPGMEGMMGGGGGMPGGMDMEALMKQMGAMGDGGMPGMEGMMGGGGMPPGMEGMMGGGDDGDDDGDDDDDDLPDLEDA